MPRYIGLGRNMPAPPNSTWRATLDPESNNNNYYNKRKFVLALVHQVLAEKGFCFKTTSGPSYWVSWVLASAEPTSKGNHFHGRYQPERMEDSQEGINLLS